MPMQNQDVSKAEMPVEPALFAFLNDRVFHAGNFGRHGLPELMTLELNKPIGAAKVDRMFRDALSMKDGHAQSILNITKLREVWGKCCSTYRSKKAGLFNYKSNSYGYIREMDLDSALTEGLNIQEIATQLVNIDIGLFNSPSPDWVGKVEDWAEIALAFPDTWRIWVTPTNEVLAYWMFVTPKDDVFNEAMLGMYPEHKILMNTLKSIDSGDLNIYGPGMYVRKDVDHFTRKMLGSLVIKSFLYHIGRLEIEGIRFKKICTPVCSLEGWHLVHEHFDLAKNRMPPVINKAYAKEMGWETQQLARCDLLPAIYISEIDDVLREKAGLFHEERAG